MEVARKVEGGIKPDVRVVLSALQRLTEGPCPFSTSPLTTSLDRVKIIDYIPPLNPPGPGPFI